MAHQIKATADLRIPEAYSIDASFLSDVGPARSKNEDSATVVFGRDRGTRVLAVVADGMGGHQAGDVASSTAVETIAECHCLHSGRVDQTLVTAFQEANRRILDRTHTDRRLAGMGTTCTAIAIHDGLAYSAHVGDSRIYLIRAGCAYRMTEDHSATMQLVDQGMLTLDEANRHEDRNLILRAMGTHETLEVAVWQAPFPVRSGDAFVLCTDGLYESISDDDIASLCTAAPTADEACRALIDAALARVCTDNVTAAVVRVREVLQ
jgi:serine/threonine protein phosphatase PrpC